MALKYNPLDPSKPFIRLLELSLSASVTSPSFALKTVSLDNNSRFLALSYVWGTQDDPVTLFINDNNVPVG